MSQSDLLDIPAIDALLERFRTRQAEQVDLATTTTDFTVDEPSTLGPEAMHAMGVRLRMVADRMAGDLSAVLRAQFSCDVQDFSLVRLRSLVDKMPSRCCVIELDVTELALPAFLAIDVGTAASIIDRMVGGTGEAKKFDRDLTDIEQRVVADVVNPVVDAYQSIMTGVAQLTMSWQRFIGTRDQLAVFPSTELYLTAKFEATVDTGLTWHFEFMLPVSQLTQELELAASIPVQTAEVARDRRQGLKRLLCEVSVDSTIEIGTSIVSLRDVSTLAEGDIIVLDSKPGQPLQFKVGGKTKYIGSLGRCGSNMGFKIEEQVDGKSSEQINRGAGG
ncbi:MAG: flagellar motor switch protein FliM [Planctomycetota bacterium]|jgi:flagellar motor switch protein FliM